MRDHVARTQTRVADASPMVNRISKKGKNQPTSLSHGRPPSSHGVKKSMTAKVTRTLIRSHHQLHKSLADAERSGNHGQATLLRDQIERQGGLEAYQQASLQGQALDRGGDTSKVLLEWLQPDLENTTETYRMLEVGALSTSNACSRSKAFAVTRIDLHSQTKGIEEQDFMKRPLPLSSADTFDIISLSLVVNYVPNASGRGQMLKRTCQFLNQNDDTGRELRQVKPSLFLVLPAPCVTNSRYLNEDRLTMIMESLGYIRAQRKLSSKLVYYLWTYESTHDKSKNQPSDFAKKEVNPGKARNNFCIVLD